MYTPEDWHRTWKWWFGRWFSSSRGVFSGSMSIFRGVIRGGNLVNIYNLKPKGRKWEKIKFHKKNLSQQSTSPKYTCPISLQRRSCHDVSCVFLHLFYVLVHYSEPLDLQILQYIASILKALRFLPGYFWMLRCPPPQWCEYQYRWSLKIRAPSQQLSTWPSSSEPENNNNFVNLKFWRRLTSPMYRETVKSLEILQPQTPSEFDSFWRRLGNLMSSQNWITNASGSKLATYFGASVGEIWTSPLCGYLSWKGTVPSQLDVGRPMFLYDCQYHRENGGTLGMVPLIISPTYTLYSGYL